MIRDEQRKAPIWRDRYEPTNQHDDHVRAWNDFIEWCHLLSRIRPGKAWQE